MYRNFAEDAERSCFAVGVVGFQKVCQHLGIGGHVITHYFRYELDSCSGPTYLQSSRVQYGELTVLLAEVEVGQHAQ